LRELVRAGADDDHDVGARGEGWGMSAERLAQESFGAVAFDGAADLSRGDDAEPRGFPFGPWREQDEQVACRDARAVLLDVQKFNTPS
jgi:hypothetical protein